MARHARRPSWRRVLALVALVLVDVVLWCAAFTAAWRHEHRSAVRVISHVSSQSDTPDPPRVIAAGQGAAPDAS